MYIEYIKGAKYPAKNAEISDDLDAFEDAGYLLEDDEVVVDIDCLDKETIKKLIDTFNLNTQIVWTQRGAHLYFKLPLGFNRNEGICALGFNVEFKRKKNSKSVTIKRFGKAREIENLGKRIPLPEFFIPKRNYETMLGLQEGENRNNFLFSHKAKISHLPEKNTILNFINQNIFAEPLDDKEFSDVTRDTGILNPKDAETVTAMAIIENHKVVSFGHQLYFYENGEYIGDEERLIRLVVEYCKNEKSRYIKEVLEQLKLKSPLIPAQTVFKIKFKNGILFDGEFLEIDYDGFTPHYIDIEYDPNAEPVEIIDNYLDQLSDYDPDYRKRILEVLGHCLIVDSEFKRMLAKFFIFRGDGGNGKGTLLQIISSILGTKNCSFLSIEEMKDERYFNTLKGKLVNLGDDLQDQPIKTKEMKLLKNVSTCDRIAMRKLFENAQDVAFTCSLIFASNHFIKSFEKSDAYKRRVDWMPMFNKPKKKDPKFITKATTPKALKYWVKLIIEAYFRIYENGEFTPCKKVTDYNNIYHQENNNTLIYVDELEDCDVEKRKPKDVYDDYLIWCEENGEDPLSRKILYSTVLSKMGYMSAPVRINGKCVRVFKKVKEK